jgi:hypothetical protein
MPLGAYLFFIQFKDWKLPTNDLRFNAPWGLFVFYTFVDFGVLNPYTKVSMPLGAYLFFIRFLSRTRILSRGRVSMPLGAYLFFILLYLGVLYHIPAVSTHIWWLNSFPGKTFEQKKSFLPGIKISHPLYIGGVEQLFPDI